MGVAEVVLLGYAAYLLWDKRYKIKEQYVIAKKKRRARRVGSNRR